MGLANHDLPAPPAGKYPAKTHARKVAEEIKKNGGNEDGVIYLEAQKTHMVEVCVPWVLSFPLVAFYIWSFLHPPPGILCYMHTKDDVIGREMFT